MTRYLKVLIVISIVSTTSYSRDFEGLTKKTVVGKERGIEVLNFYEPVPEQNNIKHYVRYEYNDDYSLIEWKLAEGYISLSEKWDFEYDIEREFYSGRDFGNGEKDFKGWDNLVGFVRDTGKHDAFNKEWSTDLGFMWEYDQLDIPSESGGSFEKSELALRYRVRTTADIGKGGTYWGFDFWAARVVGTVDDGYSLEGNLVSATNWGYGFQTFNTVYNEYYDWGDFDGTHRLGLETYTRWTYELSNHWAFATEVGIEVNNYNGGGTALDDDLEITLYPYLLYNREIVDNFRIFGEIGLPGYRYAESNGDFDSESSSGLYYVALIGVQYLW